MKIKIFENKNIKWVVSETYNYMFNKNNGNFIRWGRTREDDPQYAPAPEIADIEISTVCSGVTNIGPCKFCYKGNTPVGENMSLETFKKLFSVLPKTLTQIAVGIGDLPQIKYYKKMEQKYKTINNERYEEITREEYLVNKDNPNFIKQYEGGNPDMLDIFWHCRNNGVIPNVTINGDRLGDEMAEELSKVCGAVAVSRISDISGQKVLLKRRKKL
jgi:hypothetical protein